MAEEKADRHTEAGNFSAGCKTDNFPSSDFPTNSSFMSNAEESLNMSQLVDEKNSEGRNDDDQDDEPKSLRLSKPKLYGAYNREKLGN